MRGGLIQSKSFPGRIQISVLAGGFFQSKSLPGRILKWFQKDWFSSSGWLGGLGFSRRRAGRIGLLLEGTPSILGAAGSSKPGPGLWDPAGKRRVRWFGVPSRASKDEVLSW